MIGPLAGIGVAMLIVGWRRRSKTVAGLALALILLEARWTFSSRI